MQEKKNRKNTITPEESKAAIELQRPIQSEDQSTAIQRISTFRQLAKVSRSARLAFGSASQFVKPESLFNSGYREGLESPPFFITKAFKFESKNGFGTRLGIEIVLSNGRSYNVAFGLNEGDTKRNTILNSFAQPNAEPIGPFMLVQLDLGKGNPYYDIRPYESQTISGAEVEIPFVEIDEEIPF